MNSRNKLPVAVVVYKRPDLATQLFDAIRLYEPSRLYVISDGPKSPKDSSEAELIEHTRNVFLPDWPCEVAMLNARFNMGVSKRVISGLNWVFEREKIAVILEEDCVPDVTFFHFCESLAPLVLDAESSVCRVGGQNYWDASRTSETFRIVQSSGIWGWSTSSYYWQKFIAWEKLNPRLGKRQVVADVLKTRGLFFRLMRLRLFSRKENWSKWGVKFSVWAKLHGLSAASPRLDLVSNLGVRADATNPKRTFLPPVVSAPLVSRVEVTPTEISTSNVDYSGSRMWARRTLRHLLGRMGAKW